MGWQKHGSSWKGRCSIYSRFLRTSGKRPGCPTLLRVLCEEGGMRLTPHMFAGKPLLRIRARLQARRRVPHHLSFRAVRNRAGASESERGICIFCASGESHLMPAHHAFSFLANEWERNCFVSGHAFRRAASRHTNQPALAAVLLSQVNGEKAGVPIHFCE